MIVAIGPVAPGRQIPPVAVVDLAQAETGPRRSRSEGTPAVRAPRGCEAPERDPAVDPSRADLPDDYVLVGPRPAFEINVLERDRTVRDVLARLELQRSRNDAGTFAEPAARDTPGGLAPRPGSTDAAAGPAAEHARLGTDGQPAPRAGNTDLHPPGPGDPPHSAAAPRAGATPDAADDALPGATAPTGDSGQAAVSR